MSEIPAFEQRQKWVLTYEGEGAWSVRLDSRPSLSLEEIANTDGTKSIASQKWNNFSFVLKAPVSEGPADAFLKWAQEGQSESKLAFSLLDAAGVEVEKWELFPAKVVSFQNSEQRVSIEFEKAVLSY